MNENALDKRIEIKIHVVKKEWEKRWALCVCGKEGGGGGGG